MIPLEDGGTLQLTISAGVSALDRFTVDTAALIQASDTALYEAKARGRNAIVLFGQMSGLGGAGVG